MLSTTGPSELVDRVRELLEADCSRASFAVGYLFLDGLIPLIPALGSLDEMSILIGNVSNQVPGDQIRAAVDSRVRGGEELVREQEDVAASTRLEHDRIAAETALNLRRTIEGLPRTPEAAALLLLLARRIADGSLKIRLLSAARIHAKVAVLYYRSGLGEPAVAVVGSSNLTLAAPGTTPAVELSVVMRDKGAVGEIEEWYQAVWSSAQDFHRELFDELARSWAIHTA